MLKVFWHTLSWFFALKSPSGCLILVFFSPLQSVLWEEKLWQQERDSVRPCDHRQVGNETSFFLQKNLKKLLFFHFERSEVVPPSLSVNVCLVKIDVWFSKWSFGFVVNIFLFYCDYIFYKKMFYMFLLWNIPCEHLERSLLPNCWDR